MPTVQAERVFNWPSRAGANGPGDDGVQAISLIALNDGRTSLFGGEQTRIVRQNGSVIPGVREGG